MQQLNLMLQYVTRTAKALRLEGHVKWPCGISEKQIKKMCRPQCAVLYCIPPNEVLGILWFREKAAASAASAAAVDNRCMHDNLKSILLTFIKLCMHDGYHRGITPIVIQPCTYSWHLLRGG